MRNNNGNALFLILIALALFGALSYAVTQSSRAGGDIDREKQMIDQAVAEQCNASIEYAVNKLKTLNRCNASEISYELADGTNANSSAPSDESCHVFRATGAGATPCGDYDCDENALAALAIGESCGSIVYAGISGSNRIYTTPADQAVTSWNNGSTDVNDRTVTGASSTSNGLTNTNTLVGLSDAGAPYDAAETCRALGAEWYLPARDELHLLYTNRIVIGGFNTGGTWYWSSTESSDRFSIIQRFSADSELNRPKYASWSVRCVRR